MLNRSNVIAQLKAETARVRGKHCLFADSMNEGERLIPLAQLASFFAIEHLAECPKVSD